jgi:hypothetical protein
MLSVSVFGEFLRYLPFLTAMFWQVEVKIEPSKPGRWSNSTRQIPAKLRRVAHNSDRHFPFWPVEYLN